MDTATLGNAVQAVTDADLQVISVQLVSIYNVLLIMCCLKVHGFVRGVFHTLSEFMKVRLK